MKKPAPKEAAPKGADLRMDPGELKKLSKLFADGHAEAQKDPEKVWTEKRLREDQTPPFHGFHKLLPLPSKSAPAQPQQPSQPLQKSGGPYIGPRGGLWADPQHTIAWHLPQPREPTDPQYQQLMRKVARRGQGQGREVGLTQGELQRLLRSGRFALVSAGPNPQFPSDQAMTAGDRKARHEQLRSKLVHDGFAYTQVVGHYGGVEDSFLVMVHDAEKSYVRELGTEFRQDAVIYSEAGHHEMFYTTGEKGKAKKYVQGSGHEMKSDADDFYTEMRHPDGTVTKFSLNLDLDHEVVYKAFYDHTQPIAEADEMLYVRVKKLAMRRGYEERDFEEGGALYGWSTSELLDLLGADGEG